MGIISPSPGCWQTSKRRQAFTECYFIYLPSATPVRGTTGPQAGGTQRGSSWCGRPLPRGAPKVPAKQLAPVEDNSECSDLVPALVHHPQVLHFLQRELEGTGRREEPSTGAGSIVPILMSALPATPNRTLGDTC